MLWGERRDAGGFQRLGHAMAVALAGLGFVTGEGEAAEFVGDKLVALFLFPFRRVEKKQLLEIRGRDGAAQRIEQGKNQTLAV